MRVKGNLWIVLLLALLAAFAAGQTETYRLQPDDVIKIQLLQMYEGTQISADVPIGQDGNVSAPFVGTVKAAGKTTAELEADLVQLYEEKLKIRNPIVSVSIEQYRPIRASITGMVNQPGVYDFKPGDTIMTLISRGGGVNVDRADLKHATLRHRSSPELIPLDLHAMLYLQDMSMNYPLQVGDEVNVPEATKNVILVLGAVQQPGPVLYKEPMHLADVITAAHGPIPIRSMMSRIWITREVAGHPGQYERIKADFVKFVRKGDSSQNIELQPGDMVYVSETNTPDLVQITSILSNMIYVFSRI